MGILQGMCMLGDVLNVNTCGPLGWSDMFKPHIGFT
jgi:hypothetical protein